VWPTLSWHSEASRWGGKDKPACPGKAAVAWLTDYRAASDWAGAQAEAGGLMDIATILKEAGPYSAPLCLAMGVALRWLAGDRARILAQLEIAVADANQLRERRADDLLRHSTELREWAEAQLGSIRDALARLGGRAP